jgi:6-phosphogluconolactonase (cycloisomerase 2 family)
MGVVALIVGSVATGAWAQTMDLTQRGKERSPRISPRPATFTVQVNQADGQPDPALLEPAIFDVIFGAPIFPGSFTAADIVQNGTAPILLWSITNPSGDLRTFEIQATVDAPGGSVVPSIAGGTVGTEGTCSAESLTPGAACGDDASCIDGTCAGSNPNLPSVGIDSSVTVLFNPLECIEGTYLFVGGWSPPLIRTYCIKADGKLKFEHIAAAPGDVRDLQIGANGLSLYYAHADLSKFVVSTDGSLSLDGTVPVGGGAFDDLALSSGIPFLYGTHSNAGGVSGSQGTLRVYDTNFGNGLPTEIQVFTGLVSPHGVAISAANDQVYVANQWSFLGGTDTDPEEIVIFDRDENDGSVDLNFTTGYLARPDYFAVPPSGPRFYSTDRPGASVTTNQIGGGMTVFVDSDFSGYGATQLTLDPLGQFLYVANYNDDTITIFAVDGSELDLVEVIETCDRPEHLKFHPNGSFLFLACSGSLGGGSSIRSFAVNGTTGELTEVDSVEILDQGAYRLGVVELVD